MKNRWIKLIFILILFLLSFLFTTGQFLNLGKIFKKPFRFGLDLKGGSRIIYEPNLEKVPRESWGEAIEGARDVILKRIESEQNIFGAGSEAVVKIAKGAEKYRIIVELPGIRDLEKALKIIGQTPLLEFKELNPLYEKITQKEATTSEAIEIFKYSGLDGSKLKNASVIFDPTTNEPEVLLEFNKEGTKIFKEVTKRNIGKPLAIFLDGKSIIDTNNNGIIDEDDLYAPIVKEEISSGRAVIKGKMTLEEAKTLAKRLRYGALPVPLGEPIYKKTVGARLGEISLKESGKAGLFGFLAIFIFLTLIYRLGGIFASLSLVIYLFLFLFLIKVIPITLTLAGIGGIILSLGMAVDANVLIFERFKEERRKGLSFEEALKEAFQRAWPAIRDGNATTLLIAFLMYLSGISFIRAFSLTLILGVFLSLFQALFITKTFLELVQETKLVQIKWLWRG